MKRPILRHLPTVALLPLVWAVLLAGHVSAQGASGTPKIDSPAPEPSVFKGIGSQAGGSFKGPPDAGGPNDGGDTGPGPTGAGPISSSAPVVRGTSRRASISGTPASRSSGTRSGGPGHNAATTVSFTSDDWSTWWGTNMFDFIELRRVADRPTSGQGNAQESAAQRELRLAEVRRMVREKVLPVCRELAASPDSQVRAASVVALGKLRDGDAVDIARDLLLDNNDDVRRSAMLSLGVHRAGRANYLLMNLAHDSEIGRSLMDEDTVQINDRGTALLSACLRGERFAESIVLELLANRADLDAELLTMAADAAGLLGSVRCLRPLMEIAFDRDLQQSIRSSAAAALGRIGDPTVTPALIQLLDGELEPKRAAVVALGLVAYSGADKVVDRLVHALNHDSDAPTRHFAAISLGRIGGDRSREALRVTFDNDPAPDMRPWLALGLALTERSQPGSFVPDMLIERLSTERNLDTLGAYAIALGLCRNARGVAPLSDLLLKSRNDVVAAHAALALGLTGASEALPPLRETLARSPRPVILRQSALAVGILGDTSAIPDLVELIHQTANPFVASFAAISIAMMGDAGAVGPLLRLVEKEGPSGVTTAWAVAAIGQLFDQDRRPALSRLAAGDNYHTRTTAVSNLLDLGF